MAAESDIEVPISDDLAYHAHVQLIMRILVLHDVVLSEDPVYRLRVRHQALPVVKDKVINPWRVYAEFFLDSDIHILAERPGITADDPFKLPVPVGTGRGVQGFQPVPEEPALLFLFSL